MPRHAADVAIGDFGKSGYGDWKATGTAFQRGPASGDLLAKLEIENATGGRGQQRDRRRAADAAR